MAMTADNSPNRGVLGEGARTSAYETVVACCGLTRTLRGGVWLCARSFVSGPKVKPCLRLEDSI